MTVCPPPLPETHALSPARSRRRVTAQKAQPHGGNFTCAPQRAVANFVNPVDVGVVPWVGDRVSAVRKWWRRGVRENAPLALHGPRERGNGRAVCWGVGGEAERQWEW